MIHIPKPEIIYWITAIIILSVGFFFEGSVYITTHDTYFVVANWHISLILFVLFMLFGLVHFSLRRANRTTSTLLFTIHYLCTTGGLVGLFFIIRNQTPRQFKDYSVFDELESLDRIEQMNQWVSVIILILCVAQIGFLINVIRSFLVKKAGN